MGHSQTGFQGIHSDHPVEYFLRTCIQGTNYSHVMHVFLVLSFSNFCVSIRLLLSCSELNHDFSSGEHC